MFRRALILSLMLLSGGAPAQPAPADAAADPAAETLLRSARLWAIKNRPDLQRLALEKYLLAHPDDAQAAFALGQLEIRSARYEQVARLIAQLRAADANSAVARDLEVARRLATHDRLQMATIRRLLQTDRYAEAIAALRALFPQGPPGGELGLEYYRVIDDSDAGWDEADRGLRALLAQNPDDPLYVLELAHHLARRAATRAQGLTLIDQMRQREDAPPQRLREVWRAALSRLPENAASLPQLREYSKKYPDDTDMAAAIERMQAAVEREQRLLRDPGYRHLQAGIAELDAGRLEAAERQLLQARAQRPTDGAVSGQLGRLRLRQGRHAQAAELFQQAALQDEASQRSKWTSLTRTARFWGALRAASDATERDDLASARAQIQAALALQPGDSDALAALADNSQRRGDASSAEKIYTEILSREPTQPAALRGLTHLYAQTGRQAQALSLLQRLRQAHPRSAAALDGVRAGLLRDQAQAALTAGRTGEALRGFEAAQAADPDNAWIRFDLARLYQQLGLPGQARELMDEGIQRNPANADTRYAYALLLASLDDDAAASVQLAAVSADQMSAGMNALQQRLRIIALRRDAQERARAGDTAGAVARLRQAERVAADDLEQRDAVAAGWTDLGQAPHGLQLLRDWMHRHPQATTAERLIWVGALDRAHEETLLANEIARLRKEAPDAATRMQLDRWEVSSGLRQARALADAGRTRAALEGLTQLAQAHPKDLRVADVLADVQGSAGDLEGAIATRRQLQQRQPQDYDNRVALARLLYEHGQTLQAEQALEQLQQDSAAQDLPQRLALLRLLTRIEPRQRARNMVAELLEQYPRQPDVLLQAGRIEEADRRYVQALAYYREAQVPDRAPLEETSTLEPVLRWSPQLSDPVAGVPERQMPRRGLRLPLDTQFGASQAPADLLPLVRAQSAADRAVEGIEQRRQGYVAAGAQRYSKSGDAGTSAYESSGQALELRVPQGYDGHWFALAERVEVDAGRLPAVYDSAALYGQVQAIGPAALATFADGAPQTASGTGFGFGYQNDALRVDLGTTPLGFAVEDVVGGLRYDGDWGDLDYRLDLSRRAITSSLLSYAGAYDPATGAIWGGVRSSGLDARLAYYGPRYSWSGSLGFHRLAGREVPDNDFQSAGLSGDWRVLDAPSQRVYAGLALTLWRYAQNLGGYTFGHGGYYSPQSYVSLSLPLEWSGRYQRLSYRLRAAGSVSYSQLDAAPFYPGHAALQAAAASMPLPSGYASPFYEASSGAGTGYSLQGTLEYDLTRRWFLGGHLDIDRSAYYAPTLAQFYLRYAFQPQRDSARFPPQSLRTYSRF